MFLIDTNIISELSRPQPNQGVTNWASSITHFSVSAITIDEIYFGLYWRPNIKIQAWFAALLQNRCEVLPVDEATAKRAGRLRAQLQKQGQVRTQADMLIAATAAEHNLTLVTRNEKDFQGCGIAVLNPFS